MEVKDLIHKLKVARVLGFRLKPMNTTKEWSTRYTTFVRKLLNRFKRGSRPF